MEKTRKQYEVLNRASLFLKKHNREPKVAEILLQHHLQLTRSEFFANMRETVSEKVIAPFEDDMQKHAVNGTPVQHLTGYEIFYGRKLFVDKNVLIPRPETEELVQHIIKVTRTMDSRRPLIIADVGTGSGIIAITLALELENVHVYATDISDAALSIAKKNAAQLGATITFLQGDFLEPLMNEQIKVDILVSNPPYIAKNEAATLSDTVKFDPQLALFADDNGLAAYKKMMDDLPCTLQQQGHIAFEIGHEQGSAVLSLVKKKYPRANVQIIKDMNGKDRIVSAEITKA